MKKFIARLLGISPEIKVIRIVEDPSQKLEPLTREELESVTTLSAHPGFVALQKRLALTNQYLRSQLCGKRFTDIGEVNFLQAGIYWSDWLKSTIMESTTKLRPRLTPAYDEELEAFKKLDSMIERVG